MKIIAAMHTADWPAIISRVAGLVVLLVGVLLATRLCIASTQHNKPVVSTIDSHTSCKLEVER